MYWPRTRNGEALYVLLMFVAFLLGLLAGPMSPSGSGGWFAYALSGVVFVFVVQCLVELGLSLVGLFRRKRRE